MELDYVRIFQGVMIILCSIAYSLIIPMFAKFVGVENFNKLRRTAEILVRSTEQIMGESTGKDKKEFVLEKLQHTFPKMKREELEEMLETAVFEMNNLKNKIDENSLN